MPATSATPPPNGPPPAGDSPVAQRLRALMAAADAAEDAGQLAEMETLAREGLAQAMAAEAADAVVDFHAMLARRRAYADDWTGLIRETEPALPWLARAQDPAACVRLAGMLAIAYASLRQIDRALGLLGRVRALHDKGCGEASFLLQNKFGELHLNLGRAAEAAAFLREALRMLHTCSAEQRTPHRLTITRLLLASALLLTAAQAREAGAPDWDAPLDEVMQHLGDAEATVSHAPILAVSLDVARGYALALRGQHDAALGARLVGLSEDELGAFLPPSLPCLFDWVSTRAAAGDVAFGRGVLARTDPQRVQLPWPQLRPLWYRALGDVLAAEGDLPGAVQAMRQSIVEDRRNRDREIAMVVDMAERAALADEIAARERAAHERAERLADRNATLAAETRRWSESALTDALTGLRNRRYLEQAVATAQQAGQAGVWTVVMIDIDHFKSVNDQHSHAVGDQVLAAVGRLLGAAVREEDIAARWGGEEFVLLLRHEVGLARLDAIRQSVEAFDWPRLLPGRGVTISLGAAPWHSDQDFPAALALADQRLYAAKQGGRNRVVG